MLMLCSYVAYFCANENAIVAPRIDDITPLIFVALLPWARIWSNFKLPHYSHQMFFISNMK